MSTNTKGIYAISINKPNKSIRIHLMSCSSRTVHINNAKNQIHITDLSLEAAKEIFDLVIYNDKNYCMHCLKEYAIKKSNKNTNVLNEPCIVDKDILIELLGKLPINSKISMSQDSNASQGDIAYFFKFPDQLVKKVYYNGNWFEES